MGTTDNGPAGALTPDQRAAHQFLSELRTRISTQPLPYQHGVEARALGSLREVFDHARKAIADHPGCHEFAARAIDMLNTDLRPLTARWHRALEEGKLASRDGSDDFRAELESVQRKLRAFVQRTQSDFFNITTEDKTTPPAMPEEELKRLFEDLPYGFASFPDVDISNQSVIQMAENASVETRRKQYTLQMTENCNAAGLALSGGGIRSATFCLGVVQVLAERGLLKYVDFLSTVSGGGYTGSFITSRMGRNVEEKDLGAPHGPDTKPVQYLRQNARYLGGYNLKQQWSMVTSVLAGLLLNTSVPLALLVVLALVVHWMSARFEWAWPVDIYVSSGATLAAMIYFAGAMRTGRKEARKAGALVGGFLAFTLLIGFGKILDLGYHALFPEKGESAISNLGSIGGVAGIVGLISSAVPIAVRFIPILKEPKVRKIALRIALFIVSLLGPASGILLFYWLRAFASGHGDIAFLGSLGSTLGVSSEVAGSGILVLSAIVLSFVALFLIDINLTGPHRIYRDALARTFVERDSRGTAVGRGETIPLSKINENDRAPFHILNATLNIPASESSTIKDRGCDFFFFSKHYSGSKSVGFQKTEEWKANKKEVDLATSMAISGAAISTYMGLGSITPLRVLLTILNIRLGFWIPTTLPGATKPILPNPGFLCLIQEMTGILMHEKYRWLNLSDGGHIENMGIYELLRRRCKFIICVDGESDPTYTFHGLMASVRHAQIDFGVKLNPSLDDLRPDPKTGFCKTHYNLFTVQYPPTGQHPGGTGLLLYMKLSITGNESELIQRYRNQNPEFPHQATLDQFFDQEQFEAYRQLGVHAAEGLFHPALVGTTPPASVRHWFKQLSRNLIKS